MIQSYYASVSYVDNLLGQVFTALERKGLSENTITLLTGDHGNYVNNHVYNVILNPHSESEF